MEDELGFGNIMSEEDLETLFTEPEDIHNDDENDEPGEPEGVQVDDEGSDEKNSKKNKTTEVIDPESLFEGEEPESVGSGKNKEEKGKEDTVTDEDDGTSPNNFYSSIANALAVDGIFLNQDDDAIKKVDSAETFSDLIEAEIESRLDERQQRISKALNNGVEPSDIRKFENTLNYIASITDAAIAEEGEKGEQLRMNLIYQDFINKGYSPEKAQKFTERTINNGTDIEDAKEALQSNREFFQGEYNKLLREAQEKADAERADRQKQADKLKNSLMNDKQLFGDLEITNDIRKKAYDNISKPVYKDPETGEYLTALQKYEMENRADFLKYAGLFMALTNGFKDFDSFTKGKVKKEVRKGLRELEQTINNTSRSSNGNLRMVTGVQDDPQSFITKGMQLDI
jgi:hypothetical protein